MTYTIGPTIMFIQSIQL